MDRGAWQATVQGLHRVRHDCNDAVLMHPPVHGFPLIPPGSTHHLCLGTAMPLSQSSCIYSHLVPPPGRVAFLNAHLIRVCFYLVSLYDLRCFVRTRALRDPACGLPGPDTLPGPTVPPPSCGSLHSSQAGFDCVAPCSSKWHYSQDFASGPLYMISQNLTSFSCKPEQYTSMEKLFYEIIITLKVSLPCILSPSMIFVIPSSLVQSTTSLKPSLNAKVSLGSSFFLYNSHKNL